MAFSKWTVPQPDWLILAKMRYINGINQQKMRSFTGADIGGDLLKTARLVVDKCEVDCEQKLHLLVGQKIS